MLPNIALTGVNDISASGVATQCDYDELSVTIHRNDEYFTEKALLLFHGDMIVRLDDLRRISQLEVLISPIEWRKCETLYTPIIISHGDVIVLDPVNIDFGYVTEVVASIDSRIVHVLLCEYSCDRHIMHIGISKYLIVDVDSYASNMVGLWILVP